MPQAYVLINCDLGSEEPVIEELRHVDFVKEVHGTFGAYDIIVKLVSEKTDSLKKAITFQIRKIPKIRSTLTLMETGSQ